MNIICYNLVLYLHTVTPEKDNILNALARPGGEGNYRNIITTIVIWSLNRLILAIAVMQGCMLLGYNNVSDMMCF